MSFEEEYREESPKRGKKKQSKAQLDRLQKLASNATDLLRDYGPWNADEVWRVAQLANSAPDVQIEDDMSECWHHFPAEELTKISVMFDTNKAFRKAMQGSLHINCEELSLMKSSQLLAVSKMKSFDLGAVMEDCISAILILKGVYEPPASFMILCNFAALYKEIAKLAPNNPKSKPV
jgi:hypothetical protein